MQATAETPIPLEAFNANKQEHIQCVTTAIATFEKRLERVQTFDYAFGCPVGAAVLSYSIGAFPLLTTLVVCACIGYGIKQFRHDYYQPEQASLKNLLNRWAWCKLHTDYTTTTNPILKKMDNYIQEYTEPLHRDRSLSSALQAAAAKSFSFFRSAPSLPSVTPLRHLKINLHNSWEMGQRYLYGLNGR